MLIFCAIIGGVAVLSAVLQTLGVIPKPPVGIEAKDIPVLIIGLVLAGWLGKSCAEAKLPPDAQPRDRNVIEDVHQRPLE